MLVSDITTNTTNHLVDFDSIGQTGDKFKPAIRNYISPMILTNSRSLVAGIDIPDNVDITVCITGGGGSGSYIYKTGGGGSGNVRGVKRYLKGTIINAIVGQGSVNTRHLLTTTNGGTTIFDDLVAVGGFDGNTTPGTGVNNGGKGGRKDKSGTNRPADLCYPATYGGIYDKKTSPVAGGGAGGRGNGGTMLNLTEDNTGAGGPGELIDGYGKSGLIILSWGRTNG